MVTDEMKLDKWQIKSDLKKAYDWYETHHRELPFRENRNYYPVWVSETMLQQTRVAAMEDKFVAFMKRFPDVRSLAESKEEDVLDAWSGLGYYSRARNLRKGAKYISDYHGGEFPGNIEDALKIPGVGPYTAAAVLSIAFGKSIPVYDGNVRRVTMRYFYGLKEIAKKPEEMLMELSGNRDPGIHNQSIMELGAMICTPKKPLCSQCPLIGGCQVHEKGGAQLAEEVPPKKRENKLRTELVIYRIGDDENFIIVKDAKSRFFRNLWFFPHTVTIEGESVYKTPGLELIVAETKKKGKKRDNIFKHSITTHDISVGLQTIRTGLPMKDYPRVATNENIELMSVAKEEIGKYAVSSVSKKLKVYLEKQGQW